MACKEIDIVNGSKLLRTQKFRGFDVCEVIFIKIEIVHIFRHADAMALKKTIPI